MNVKQVFIVGSPRSGTSWLQLLLAQHSNVATTQETHLFDLYLRHLKRSWERVKVRQPDIGLSLLLSDTDFFGLCAEFATKVLERIAATNPGATVVLEKTPDHIREAPFILQLFPNAYFLHIVRDPRSVVNSLRAASRSWGARWASASVVHNARLWQSDVTLGRDIGRLTSRYREVRYEDLLSARAAEVLEGVFAWLELPADRAFVTSALSACRIERLRDGGTGVRAYELLKRPQPARFFRRGVAASWKEELSAGAIGIIEYINRPLMEQWGYPCVSPRATRSAKPFGLAAHDALALVDRQVRRGVDTVFRKAWSLISG